MPTRSQPTNNAIIDRVRSLAAHVNAAHAELARLAVQIDDEELWSGCGIRSCEHWLTINTGTGMHAAEELLRVGRAVNDLPALRGAFASGRISLDKLRAVTQVATSADEDVWLEVALYASGAQLQRICRAYLRTGDADGTATADERRSKRGLWTFWRDDGMLDLRAVLSPEDGAMVLAALDAAADRTGTPEQVSGPAACVDPSDERRPARRADALVALFEDAARDQAGQRAGGGAAQRLVVHVDAAVLTGERSDGRCHVENGPALSASIARRLGCDAEVVAVTERDGLPIDVGRARRTISARLRLALQTRDRGCRFPGCGVPTRFTDGHHVTHWAHGGRTDLANLISLCRFHHGRHHDGAFDIVLTDDRTPRFLSPRGVPFAEPAGPPLVRPSRRRLRRLLGAQAAAVIQASPVAADGGARFDLVYATEILHSACEHRRDLTAASSFP